MPAETAPPRVGVVTVTYNSADVLDDFLDSASAQQDVELRLYAVDNDSKDDSVERLRAETRLPHVSVVANAHNAGVAEGNNQGIAAALQDGCDWVLLLNNDTVFPPDLVTTLVRNAELDRAKLVAPVIEATEPAHTIWYAGGRIRGFSRVTRHLRVGAPIESAPIERSATGYASTCCLLVHPEVFASVGLMDPSYFVYFDDVDFAARALEAGYRYRLDPGVRLLHKASALTGGKESPFTVSWTARNWPYTVRRNRRGLARLLGLAYVQLWICGRLVVRRDAWQDFLLRQRKFREALTLPLVAAQRAAVPVGT